MVGAQAQSQYTTFQFGELQFERLKAGFDLSVRVASVNTVSQEDDGQILGLALVVVKDVLTDPVEALHKIFSRSCPLTLYVLQIFIFVGCFLDLRLAVVKEDGDEAFEGRFVAETGLSHLKSTRTESLEGFAPH